jgi:hypothetical protein
VVFADLCGGVAKWFEQLGARWIFVLQALLGGGQTNR